MSAEGCDAIRPFLAACLGGSLSGGDRNPVERHLAACAACRTEWADFRSLHELLGKDAGVPPPPEVLSGALAVLAGESGKPRSAWLRYAIPAGVAAAILLGLAGYFLRDAARGQRPAASVLPPLSTPVATARSPLPEPLIPIPVLVFHPVAAGFASDQIAWRRDAHETIALAGDARSTVLCMVDNPQCGYCSHLRTNVMSDGMLVEASRRFLCLWMDYRDVKEEAVRPPLIGIVAPCGEMIARYGGDPLDKRSLVAWLRENAPDGHSTYSFEGVVRTEETLQEAFDACSGGDPAGAARKLAEFYEFCASPCLAAHLAQAEALREALREHVDSRCAFVWDLVANGELPRAREACKALAEEFRGTLFGPAVDTLAAEIAGLPR